MVPDLMRLHITPFNPDYLKAVVGPLLLDSVLNISYHTIQTFPENNYGYIEVPRTEGQKIKRKLNGAILKGKKMKIDEVRPNKRRRVEEHEEEVPAGKSTVQKAKKSRLGRNVVAGHELPPDRKVKRGWTEVKPTKPDKKPKAKTVSSKSKYSDQDELLFRTNVPANRMDGKDVAHKEKGKPKRKSSERIVHEFEKSTKQPSFLKQDVGLGIKANLEYVEDRGWVDEAGEVVEKVTRSATKRQEEAKARVRPKRKVATGAEGPSETSKPSGKQSESPEVGDDEETSSSGSSSSTNSGEETSDSLETSESTSDKPETGDPSDVHPLEALFKRPSKPTSQDIAKPSLEVSTSFSFFDAENADDLDEEEPVVPLTPFSSQEFRSRGLRSAAPTPDTAHPSRFNSYGSSGLPGDEDEEEGKEGRSAALRTVTPETSLRVQSDFEKKFWENRAENNRAWKLRRRTVLKEKRQRENKARRPKNW